MVYKNKKRPYGEDESCNVSFKHPRQLDYTSLAGSVLCNNSLEKPHKSGGFNKFQGEERLASCTISELFVADDKEFESCALGSISGLSWVTSSTSEEDATSEPTLQVSWSPGFCDDDRPSGVSVESEEMFSSLASYPHRKLVSIGPDHQADVPVWGSVGSRKAPNYFNLGTQGACDSDAKASFPPSLLPLSEPSSHIMLDDNWEQLMGTCILPMPKDDSFGHVSGNFGHGRVDCNCPDEGSVRCVRLHVKEAREKLLVTLGQERFVELGFCDMGEDVALKWSEEDEQVFHEVVFSNPASLGKNFWDHLSEVFPTRTNKDLVSYYFNVFILRKRAEQNRRDPLNVDSDDDEWQASDDGDEFATTEEDEDSAVESPAADQGRTVYSEDSHGNYHGDEDDDEDYIDDNDDSEGAAPNLATVEDDVGGLDDVSQMQVSSSKSSSCKSLNYHNFVPTDYLASNDLQSGSEEQDIPDESCTSYECQNSGAVSSVPSDMTAALEQPFDTGHSNLHAEFGNASFFGMVDHSYVFDPCEDRFWDAGFFTGKINDADFLPTRSMIEEVFRDEIWNDNDASDGPHFS